MNKLVKIVSICLGLSFLVLSASAFQSFAADSAKIGLVYSLSGPGAPLGKLQEQGAKLAITEINAAGGVDVGGQKVKLEAVVKDDETKPPAAVQAVKDMVKSQGVKAVVGSTFAHTGMAVNNEAKESKVFYMSTCALPADFFKKDVKAPTALGIFGSAEDVSRAAILYMLDKMKAKKIACFVPAYAFGQAAVTVMEQEVKKRPGVKHEVFWHPVGSTDMKRDLTKVAEFKPDAIYVQSWGQDAINALEQATKMGLAKDTPIVYVSLTNAYATGISPEAMQGLKAGMSWYHDMSGFSDPAVVKASEEFAANYMKAYNIPPDPYAMMAYYGVKETARAMALAKSTDPEKMYAALMANPEWESAKGPAKWRKDGRPEYKYFAWIVQGKGPGERKSGKYDSSFDFAQILDVVSGENLLPKLDTLGY